jgi:signal transduction histidine kinase/CheY-like chemotaxis protein
MALFHGAQRVIDQAMSSWWAKDLVGRQHTMLQGYLFLIFLILIGFCFIQGPTDYLLSNLLALAAYALLYLLYVRRIVGLKWTTHGMIVISFSLIFSILLGGGGLSSPLMLWLGIVPVPAIFLLGISSSLKWAASAIFGILSLFALTLLGWLPSVVHYERSHITWAAVSSLCVASSVFFLPLIYHLLNQRQLAEIEKRNTELEQTRTELLASESHKDRFMAAVGHELRTPMNAILGFNELLHQDKQLSADDQETVALISQSTRKLLKIINQILDFSQLQARRLLLSMEPTLLEEELQHVVNSIRPQLNPQVKLQLELAPDVPIWIHTDAQRLKEVLMSLLDNACKFTSEGEVVLRISVQEQQLWFEVIDSGTGIAAEFQAHIFNRFEHADQETLRQFGGTGLGLAVAKLLIELFEGQIGLESELGQGSRFWFHIPLQPCEAPDHALTSPLSLPVWDGPFNLLLVDDHLVNLQLARHLCQSIWPQANILSVASGADCLSTLKKSAVDLVLMDMFMPEMNGPQTCQTIRQEFTSPVCDVPIIGLTASTHPHDLQACMDAGMNAVILKPIDKTALTKVVQAHLSSRLIQGTAA